MKTSYKGIDYGLNQSNINRETGIRFGVISEAEVGECWIDNCDYNYGKPHCPKCGNELPESFDDGENCPHCDHHVKWVGEECFPDCPNSYFYNKDGYTCQQSGDDRDVFVLKSPYFTFAQFCSPCAPGACYLMNWLEGDENCETNKAYCLGHDWFDGGKAPYPVYSVETGELVNPE